MKTNATNDKVLLSVDDVVAATGVCRTNVYFAMRDGRLKAVKIGRRTFVRPADLQAFVDAAEARPINARNVAA